MPLDRVLHEVEIPERLRQLPYLQPVYDHPQFLVRNVWRRYGGWYDGEPDNLLPAPRAEQAREWVTLAGGLERVLARARELAAAGDHRLACHLVEFAVLYEPGSTEAHEVRAEVYAARSAEQVSSMARNILGHAAHASREGKRDLAGDYGGLSRRSDRPAGPRRSHPARAARRCASSSPSSRSTSRLSGPSVGAGVICTAHRSKWNGDPG